MLKAYFDTTSGSSSFGSYSLSGVYAGITLSVFSSFITLRGTSCWKRCEVRSAQKKEKIFRRKILGFFGSRGSELYRLLHVKITLDRWQYGIINARISPAELLKLLDY